MSEDTTTYYEDLKKLRDNIDTLDKSKHIELFNLIKENDIQYSSNKNGIFINLSFVEKEKIDKIKNFVYLINERENYINEVENEKDKMKNYFFSNEKE